MLILDCWEPRDRGFQTMLKFRSSLWQFLCPEGNFLRLDVNDLFELMRRVDMCQVMLTSSIINQSLHLPVVSDLNCRRRRRQAAALLPEQSNFTRNWPEHHLLNCNSLSSILIPTSRVAHQVATCTATIAKKLQSATLANLKTWCKKPVSSFWTFIQTQSWISCCRTNSGLIHLQLISAENNLAFLWWGILWKRVVYRLSWLSFHRKFLRNEHAENSFNMSFTIQDVVH